MGTDRLRPRAPARRQKAADHEVIGLRTMKGGPFKSGSHAGGRPFGRLDDALEGIRTLRRGDPSPTGHLGGEVEAFDHSAVLVLSPGVAREHPHDLELVSVGVCSIEALGRAMG